MEKGYFSAYKEEESCKLPFDSLFCEANEKTMHLDGMKIHLNYNIKWDARSVRCPCSESNDKRSGAGQLLLVKPGEL